MTREGLWDPGHQKPWGHLIFPWYTPLACCNKEVVLPLCKNGDLQTLSDKTSVGAFWDALGGRSGRRVACVIKERDPRWR